MCFSEQASFTAAAALTIISVGCLYIVRQHTQLLALALIPFFFALQQSAEGVQWLYFKGIWGTSQQAETAKTIYLFFAYSFWPFWMPFSFYLAEEDPKRKNLLLMILSGALLYSGYLLYTLFTYSATALPVNQSIQYFSKVPENALWAYILVVISPLFISTLPGMTYVGLAYLASSLIAGFLFENRFVSVWCFFAAIISIFLFFALKLSSKKTSTKPPQAGFHH